MTPPDDSSSDADPEQPWQVQHVERLSRGLNRKTPYVRRQVRLFLLGVGGIVALVLVAFLVTSVG